MTCDLKDVGERGTALSFDPGERPQILFTGPERKMDDSSGLYASCTTCPLNNHRATSREHP